MARFDHDGLEIYFEVLGCGPRLLFLNGSGSTVDTSRFLIDQLATSFTVAVHDQRGLGKTGVGRTSAPYEMSDYAADAAALLDHLEWPSTRIFGISFGGMVAQEFAVTWPSRVERLALLCTSSGGQGGSSYPLHRLGELSETERREISRRLIDNRFDDEWLQSHPKDRAMVEFRESAPRETSGVVGEGMARQLDARSRHDTYARLGAISAPTLIAGGLYDAVATPENVRALAQAITSSELRMYEGGHLFAVQDRRAMPEIIEFLRNP
jgi:pimeloyl-ACP methyl ester carboxylesterase